MNALDHEARWSLRLRSGQERAVQWGRRATGVARAQRKGYSTFAPEALITGASFFSSARR
jgi:hypothetical protein